MEKKGAEEFGEWFIVRLVDSCLQVVFLWRDVIWGLIDALLASQKAATPSLGDARSIALRMSEGSTTAAFSLVGLPTGPEVGAVLRMSAMRLPPPIDMTTDAYKLGKIRKTISRGESWRSLHGRLRTVRLSKIEQKTVEIIRGRAGLHLKPVFDQYGNQCMLYREIKPLRKILAGGVEVRKQTREMIRELANTYRAKEIARDAMRVVRTEIADARSRGSWSVEGENKNEDDLMFRQAGINACKWCIKVFVNPDGTPRLWKKSEIEEGDKEPFGVMGVPRIGPLHPNCACGPWETYHKALRHVFSHGANAYREKYAEHWGA